MKGSFEKMNINVEKVTEVMNCLKKDKIEELGTKVMYEYILQKFIDYNELDIIFDNDHFIIEYDKNKGEFILSTSFSNQVVDEFFMEALKILYKKVKEINNIINR